MGLGIGSLSTNQFRPPASGGGAPFPAGSADNGLSVDPVTGRIVLGGDLGTPSTLLSMRHIDFDAYLLLMTSTAVPARNYQSFISPGVIDLNEVNTSNRLQLIVTEANADLIINSSAPGIDPVIQLFNSFGFDGRITVANGDLIEISQGGRRVLTMSNNPPTDNYTLGDSDGAASGIRMELQGLPGPGSSVNFSNAAGDVVMRINGAVPLAGEFLAIGGSFTTADPGSGQATWKLGSVVAGAAVLDAANFVETEINGAIVKLAVIV